MIRLSEERDYSPGNLILDHTIKHERSYFG
jgi:hypothetical protein